MESGRKCTLCTPVLSVKRTTSPRWASTSDGSKRLLPCSSVIIWTTMILPPGSGVRFSAMSVLDVAAVAGGGAAVWVLSEVFSPPPHAPNATATATMRGTVGKGRKRFIVRVLVMRF